MGWDDVVFNGMKNVGAKWSRGIVVRLPVDNPLAVLSMQCYAA